MIVNVTISNLFIAINILASCPKTNPKFRLLTPAINCASRLTGEPSASWRMTRLL